jgi:hypothetical protein
MPPLRKWVASARTAGPGLIAVFVVALLLGDVARAPERQILARGYVYAVHVYQHSVRPLLVPYVRCRYKPTCSEYSAQAVQRFGLVRGVALTLRRVASCRTGVALGTADPVPEH